MIMLLCMAKQVKPTANQNKSGLTFVKNKCNPHRIAISDHVCAVHALLPVHDMNIVLSSTLFTSPQALHALHNISAYYSC